MKKVAISGSIAYDHIMSFDGFFADSILANELSNLSVSFLAQNHEVFFGGCSANAAYTLKMLGVEPLVFAVLGNDYQNYFDWLAKNSISTDYIFADADKQSAAAYILTDKSQNQICFFSPSAMSNTDNCMNFSGLASGEASCALITPGLPSRMLSMARSAKSLSLPYIFDPGQALSALSKSDLHEIVINAAGVILNSYESVLLEKTLDLEISDLLNNLDFLIVTLGENGAMLYEKSSEIIQVPAISGLNIMDPTGCGDAFRAGFLAAYLSEKTLLESCQSGTVAASFALESVGTQCHKFSFEEFNSRLEDSFGIK